MVWHEGATKNTKIKNAKKISGNLPPIVAFQLEKLTVLRFGGDVSFA